MSYVGLDIDKCSELKAHLDQAAADLNAHAATVVALLAQAGIQSCQAPAELRDVAAWAAYRSRDLQKRIDKARAADSGRGNAAPTGFRFASDEDARKAGIEEAKKINDLVHGGKDNEVRAELDKVRQYSSDTNFAAAFLSRLGREGLATLLHMLAGDGQRNARHPETVVRDMALLAGMLARLSNGSNADRKVSNELLARLRRPDLVGELAVMFSFGGFSSRFTADAARSILGANSGDAAIAALAVMGLTRLRPRDIALQALDKDAEAAYLYVTRASLQELRALLDDPGDNDGGALAAKVLQTGLLGAGNNRERLKLAEDALERVMTAIAKGAPLTDAARLAVAKALYPEFLSGRIGAQAGFDSHLSPGKADFNVSRADMQKCFDELMKNDKSRDELERGARDYTAQALAQSIATGKDFDVVARNVGSLLGVMSRAARDHIDEKGASVDFGLTLLRTSGHIAAGILSKYTGPVAPLTGAAGNYAVDKGVDALKADQAAKAAGDRRSVDDKIDAQVAATLTQICYAMPQYRALATSPPPDNIDELLRWLKANNDFASAITARQRDLDIWLTRELGRGKP
jgi:hypothetical protein